MPHDCCCSAQEPQAASSERGPGSKLAACSLSVTSLSQTFTLGSLSIYGRALHFLLTDGAIPCRHLSCSMCVCETDRQRKRKESESVYLTRQTDLALASLVYRSVFWIHLSILNIQMFVSMQM